jgi:hypothetical protein
MVETVGDPVVSGYVQVYHIVATLPAGGFPGPGLEELAGKVPRFGEQKNTNLGNVGSGADVKEVFVSFWIKIYGRTEGQKFFVYLFKVPGVAEFHDMGKDLCPGRYGGDILQNRFGNMIKMGIVNEMKLINGEFGV